MNDIDVYNVNFVKFAITEVVMLLELAYIYFRKRSTADVVLMYLMFSNLILSVSIGFELDFNVTLGLYAVETLILSINDAVLRVRDNVSESAKNCGTVIYILTLASITSVFLIYCLVDMFMEDDFGKVSIIAMILLAATLIGFVVRKDVLARMLASAWTAIAMMTISGDIIFKLDVIPDFYGPEFSLILTIVFIVLVKIFWYDVPKAHETVDALTYILAVITGLRMLAHNVMSDEIACVLTLGIIAVAVLVWSSIINERKYQLLSGIILGLMAIYMTRTFWLSIAWWVYLLVAGIACIVIAILKEKKVRAEEESFAQFTAKVTDVNMDMSEIMPSVEEIELDFVKEMQSVNTQTR